MFQFETSVLFISEMHVIMAENLLLGIGQWFGIYFMIYFLSNLYRHSFECGFNFVRAQLALRLLVMHYS